MKKIHKLLIGLLLAGLLGTAAWFGWRWYTTPSPPHVPLDGVDRELAEVVTKALEEVRRQPRSAEAWGRLSLVLTANGFEEPALASLVQAERLDPSYACWPYLRGILLLARDSRDGLPPLRRALSLAEQPRNRGALLFVLITALLKEGEFDEAEQHLQALHEIEGDSPPVHFVRGRLAIARGDWDEARKSMSLLTENPFAQKQACSMLASLSAADPTQARVYQERAARLPRDLPWPAPFEEEIRAYKVERNRWLAELQDLEQQGRSAEALALLRKYAATSPDAEVCYALGVALLDMDQPAEAVAQLRTALAFDGRNVKAHSHLGAALYRWGEKRLREPHGKEAARELFRQALAAEDAALALQGNHGLAHLTRGKALKQLGRTEDALRALREGLVCQPESADMHLALGEALAEAGQLREGLEHLENAVRLAAPNDLRPRQAREKWRGKSAKSLSPSER